MGEGALFSGIKRLEHEAEHSFPHITEVLNARNFNLAKDIHNDEKVTSSQNFLTVSLCTELNNGAPRDHESP
jgi:hypothetical protein